MKLAPNLKEHKSDNPTESSDFKDKYDLAKFTGTPHASIKDSVTADTILAKLNDKDKKFTIEMTQNADFLYRMIMNVSRRVALNAKQQNSNKLLDQAELIKQEAISLHSHMMLRVNMIAVTNRNVANNHILRLLLGNPETEEEERALAEEKRKAPAEAMKRIMENSEKPK